MSSPRDQQQNEQKRTSLDVIRYEPIDPLMELAAAVLEASRQSELPTINL